MRIPLGNPLQLLLLVCSFALAGYAGVRLLAGADRALVKTAGRHVLYVRVPAALSLLLLLVWFPLISGQVADRYASATGLSPDGFLARWLLVTAVLFGGSAVVFVVRRRRDTKERPPAVH